MAQIFIALSELPPSLRAVLKRINYRRQDVRIDSGTTFRLAEGAPVLVGGPGHIVAVNLSTGDFEAYRHEGSSEREYNCEEPVEDREQVRPIPAGGALVFTEWAPGGMLANIRIHPDSVAGILPDTAEVSDDERKALGVIKRYTSAGRKEEMPREGLGEYSR